MKISVVIPVYNEVDSIPRLYKELNDVLSNLDWYEIFFIDDGSSDGSDKVIKKIIETNSKINLIQFHRNYGKSAALAEGFKYADGDYVITMDSDLQDDPGEIPNLIKKLEQLFNNHQIYINKFICSNYANSIDKNNSNLNICESGLKLIQGINKQEVEIVPRKLEKKGFFERLFHLFK